jgi:hypothetical protein
MSIENQNPAATPNQGQAPGQENNPANNTSAADNNQPQEGKDEKKIEIDISEYEQYKRDAGRFRAQQKKAREERRANRRSNPQENYDVDGAPPEVLEALRSKDNKLEELSTTNRELMVKDKVRDLMESDDYKGIPATIKKAIIRNPLGFVNPISESLEDAVADIQDYLDEELDNPSVPNYQTNDQGQENKNISQDDHQTPPVNGSGPEKPGSQEEYDITGKTGPARSTAILGNLLKKRN